VGVNIESFLRDLDETLARALEASRDRAGVPDGR
jgi:hypothetical protein